MDLIAAGRIIAMHHHRSVVEFSKVSRPPGVIENHLLVKIFQFRIHEKKRVAA
jgi:hypothetical protein